MNKICFFIKDCISTIKIKYHEFKSLVKKIKWYLLGIMLFLMFCVAHYNYKGLGYKDFQSKLLDLLAGMINGFVDIFFKVLYFIVVNQYIWIIFLLLGVFFLYCKDKSIYNYDIYWEKKGREKKIQEFADNFRKSWWTVIFLGGLLTLLGITNFAKNRNSQNTLKSMIIDINQTKLDMHRIELSLKKLILQSDSLLDKVDSLKKKFKATNQLEQTIQTLVKDIEKIKQNKQESLLVKENNVSH